jgi:hypothetical protein
VEYQPKKKTIRGGDYSFVSGFSGVGGPNDLSNGFSRGNISNGFGNQNALGGNISYVSGFIGGGIGLDTSIIGGNDDKGDEIDINELNNYI